MDQNIIIGLLALAFGLVTLVLRFVAPDKLGKLEPMKKMFGPAAGTALHVTAYTVVPLGFGGLMLFKSLAP